MGICGEDKIKQEEKKDQKTIPFQIGDKLMKSICRIIIEKEGIIANGFFMKITDSLKYIITNYYNLSQYSNDNIEIEIWNKEKMSLNLKKRYIKYYSENQKMLQ